MYDSRCILQSPCLTWSSNQSFEKKPQLRRTTDSKSVVKSNEPN